MPAREVFNVLTQPDGTPIENAVVEIRLVANTTTQRGEGFVTSTQESILWRKHVSTDEDGRWEANLQPNSEITPAGTVYLISEDPPGRAKAEQHYISVPDTAGPHWLYDILTEAPASLASSALELHRDSVKDHEDWSDSAPSAGQVPIWNGSAYVPGDTVATDIEAAALVTAHNADTTDVHGIPDTSALMVEGDGAGGVLSGTYPSPGFAVDMATQAELDSHISDATAAHAASAISVTPTGGLAADDVQEALSELQSDLDAKQALSVVTVKEHGAVGDGTTNDRAAIRAAIDTVSAAGGGTVFFPEGTYLLGTVLGNIPSNVSLVGANRRTSVLKSADSLGAGHFLVTLSACSNVRIAHLGFQSIAAGSSQAVKMTTATDCLVEDCWFNNGYGWSVFIGVNSRACGVRGIYSEGTSSSHSVEINDSSYCFVESSHLKSSQAQGIEVYMQTAGECIGTRLEGNFVDACGSGIQCFGDTRTVIADNVVRNSSSHGVYLYHSEILGSAYPSQYGTFTGNVVDGSNQSNGGANNIFVTATTKEWTFSGNVITNCAGTSGAGGYGILVNGLRNTFSANTISLNSTYGIVLNTNAQRNSVVGNTVHDNSVSNIAWGAGIGVSGDDNTIIGNLSMDTRATKRQTHGVVISSGADRNVVIGNKGLWGQSGLFLIDSGTGTLLLGNENETNFKLPNALQHTGSTAGFYGTTPIAKQTGVAVTAAGVHAALVNLGLISA